MIDVIISSVCIEAENKIKPTAFYTYRMENFENSTTQQ